MTNLKLSLEKAQEAYKKGDQSIKDFLINAYGEEHFLVDIKDRVQSYEDACREIGITPLTESDFGILPKEDQKRAFNRHQLTIVIKALNQGWYPNWKNSNEAKYYIYLYHENSGFSFRVGAAYCHYGSVGSDLYVKTRELAEHLKTYFKTQY